MNKKYLAKKLWVAVVLGLAMVLQSTNAFAREKDRGGDRQRPGGDRQRAREVVTVGRQRYSYHDGNFYKLGLFSFAIALGVPVLGAVVHFLPFGHRSLVINGLTYYHYNNVYYRACPSGYVVVSDPVVNQNVIAVQNLSGERVPINIPNSNGSYTAIMLVKQEDGYLGPQGEYYPGNPTIEQLKSLYGK
jgi:hypothetical protein